MSLVKLGYICSHLQNCATRRIPLTSIPYTRQSINVALHLYKEGFISAISKGSVVRPDLPSENIEVTFDNIATRKLWVTLKYRDNQPVLGKFRLVSTPSQKFFLSDVEIKALSSGLSVRKIKPQQPGELILVQLEDKKIIDLQEAAKNNVGGLVLCRART
ncbi:mitochondrial 37S ribosomal protein uS8m MRPS8 [Ascoidea rubescens DSM 1968]|uniref:Mitochondrial ribosomal protein of the small subunit n=1 Tax=Ascoidea rubescens DSM 1968 TaxID=1344418 RepID=A0A1D2VQW2_9ASCO|nr:mitochondrial ribosomal protein of the small subunit [Ascoidea rubescens DSM 1968]ODV64006.1 mitochondrial ribosomal protein of the small subunit [Ascoidea rubescens DSM 1968]